MWGNGEGKLWIRALLESRVSAFNVAAKGVRTGSIWLTEMDQNVAHCE